MTPDAGYYHFPSEIWDAVNEHANYALVCKDYCPEQSEIEGIRCVLLEEESEQEYGRQIWFFEARAVDPVGRNHQLYGVLDFNVQYGLLEPTRAMLSDESLHRHRLLQSLAQPVNQQVWAAPSTKIWVKLTIASVLILSAIWLLTLAGYLMEA